MKRVLLDTNILMDIVLERTPFDALAYKIMGFIETQQVTAYVSAINIININYIVKKPKVKRLRYNLFLKL